MTTRPETLVAASGAVGTTVADGVQSAQAAVVASQASSALADINPGVGPTANTRRLIMHAAANGVGHAAARDLQSSGISSSPEPSPAVNVNRSSSSIAADKVAADRARQDLQQQMSAPAAEIRTEKPKERTWSGWWSSVTSSVSDGLQTAKNALVGLDKLRVNVGTAIGEAAAAVINDPKAALEKTISAAKTVGNFVASAGEFIGNGIASGVTWCIENPEKILPAVGSFLWSAGTTICSIVGGLFSSVLNGVKQVLNGEMTIGEALVKTFVFACEMSGLADAWGVVKHGALALAAYGSGDKQAMFQHLGQVAMHGTFLAIALATVSTAGVAAPVLVPLMAMRSLVSVALKQGVKQGIKACAREFLESGAKQIAEGAIKNMGEPAVKKLATEFPQELVKVAAMAEKVVGTGATAEALARKTQELALERVIQLQGESIAKTMGRSMSDDLAKVGAEKVLTTTYVKELGEKVGYEQTKALLQQLGLVDYVDDLTFKLLSPMKEMTGKQARQHIIDTMGVSSKEADKMAREVQRLIKSGKSDDAIKQILEERITNDVSKFVAGKMENSFKDTFRKGLRGELTDADNAAWSKNLNEAVEKRAKELGKSVDELTDDLVKAGWEGVENGIKRATRELVREGLERAFKRLRDDGLRKPSPRSSDKQGESGSEGRGASELATDTEQRRDEKQADKGSEVPSGSGHEREIRKHVVTREDGSTVEVVSTYDGEQLTAQQETLVSGPDHKKGSEHEHDFAQEATQPDAPEVRLNRSDAVNSKNTAGTRITAA
jgi:hypothetical protein